MAAMKALACNIKTLRQLHGMSQKDLADKIGSSYPRISEIERGLANPTLSTLQAIADVFGTTVSGLLYESKENLEKLPA